MLKKAIIGAGTVAALGALVFGRDVMSYARAAYSATREAVKREVPLEFEVQRARTAVQQLEPAIQRTLKTIAEQQVDIEHLSRDVSMRTTELQRQKDQLLTLRTDLATGKSTFRYAGLEYSADSVQRDLGRRFDRFKTAQALLDRDQRILAAREQTLVAHEKTLDQMLGSKKDLEARVEQLDARLQTIRAEQAVSAPEIDESELSTVKRLIAEVNKQLDVQEKLLDAQGKFVGLIPVDVKPTVDLGGLTAEIDEYFKPAEKKPVEAAKPVPSIAKAEAVKH
jgi:chromosome segregation ATPase